MTAAPETRAAGPVEGPTAKTRNDGVRQAQGHPKGKQRFDERQHRAEEIARQLVAAIAEHGRGALHGLPLESFPTSPLAGIAERTLAATDAGARGFSDVMIQSFMDAPDHIRALFIECSEGFFPPRAEHCKPLADALRTFHAERRKREIADSIRKALDQGDDIDAHLAELAKLETAGTGKSESRIVAGVLSYPTNIPAELVLLGNGWLRLWEMATFISTAGNGKSVAMAQASMAWGLGLPYLGIRPARPLRILLFSGEDDEATIGQCREGFLEHSEAITGRRLSAADLAGLDPMMRTEFSREHVGPRFHGHLAALLRDQPADLVIINPLLSYIGGEIVSKASEFLRAGLMPILQQFDCAALIAHHTVKMSKDGWDNTEDTYSAIGGGEMANIPRAILTLRPTAAEGLSVLKVSKRQTTGWKDADGRFCTSYFVRRTDNPERPAWLPVDSDEAQELLDASKGDGGTGKGGRKVSVENVTAALDTGDMQRQALIDWLRRECSCSERPARDAIGEATSTGLVRTYTENNPRGGKPLRWFALNREEIQ